MNNMATKKNKPSRPKPLMAKAGYTKTKRRYDKGGKIKK